MSVRALFGAMQVMARNDISPSAKLVYVALANRHNQETGRCDPSVDRIMADTGMSRRAVIYGIRSLEKSGQITTVHRRQRTGRGVKNMTNRYRLKASAKFAHGMGQNLHPKQEYTQPSAFDDLAMLIEGGGDA